MTSPISNIARSALLDKPSLNILSFLYTDWFNSALCNALPQHKFYAPINDANKPATWNFNFYPQPHNLHFISNFPTSNIQNKIDFDLVICNDRSSQYGLSKQIANVLHINVIILEHLASTEYIDIVSMIPVLKQTKLDTNVFIEDGVGDNLKLTGPTIKYGIPNLFQKEKKKQIFLSYKYQHLQQTIADMSNLPVVCEDYTNLGDYYTNLKNSLFYFNVEAETAVFQVEILLAMSAGCIVCTVDSPVIKQLIKHLETGIIIAKMEELAPILRQLSTQDLNKIIDRAHSISTKFNLESFTEQWNDILYKTNNKVYTR